MKKYPYRKPEWLGLAKRSPMAQRYPDPKVRPAWIPNTHVSIKKSISRLGYEKIAGWNGSELEAKIFCDPPDPPWEWNLCFKEKEGLNRLVSGLDHFIITDDCRVRDVSKDTAFKWWREIEPKLKSEWEDIKQAHSRKIAAIDLMRNELAAQKFTAYILDKDGHLTAIPVEKWRSQLGERLVFSDRATIEIAAEFVSYTIQGAVVLTADFLDIPEHGEATAESEQPQYCSPNDPIERNQFPYLHFMVLAAQNAEMFGKDRTPIKEVETWLSDNWPDSLGKPSPTKIRNMATFLRRPQDEKGGLHGKGQGN